LVRKCLARIWIQILNKWNSCEIDGKNLLPKDQAIEIVNSALNCGEAATRATVNSIPDGGIDDALEFIARFIPVRGVKSRN